jgi:hypothetical protein
MTKGIGVRLTYLGKPNFGFQTFDRSWGLTENGEWRFAPNDGAGIQAPLAVGKTWSIKATDVNTAGGFSRKRSGTSKVTARQAGRFSFDPRQQTMAAHLPMGWQPRRSNRYLSRRPRLYVR